MHQLSLERLQKCTLANFIILIVFLRVLFHKLEVLALFHTNSNVIIKSKWHFYFPPTLTTNKDEIHTSSFITFRSCDITVCQNSWHRHTKEIQFFCLHSGQPLEYGRDRREIEENEPRGKFSYDE